METEQPVLDLTEKQEAEKIVPNTYSDGELDMSAYSLDLGF